MALIKCPKCGKEFSDRIVACPQCGTSKEEIQRLIQEKVERKAKELAQKRARNFKRVGLGLFAVLLVFCIYVVYINVTPITAKNKIKLEAAINNPFRFIKNTDSLRVRIPNGTKEIEERAFYECDYHINSIIIPKSVTMIGEIAFGYDRIENIYYKGNLKDWCNKSWSPFSVSHLYNLYIDGEIITDLKIPDNITSIGDNAFAGCYSLTSIHIPNTVKSIGDDAFAAYYSYDNISSIICTAHTPPSCQKTTFATVSKTTPVYVPAPSISAYKKATGWNAFTNIQAIKE